MWRTGLLLAVGVVVLGSCKSATSPNCSGACVTIQDFSFSPATLSVKAGTTVQWINNGPSGHTTTSDGSVWTSGTLAPPSGGGGYGGGTAGGTYQFTFNTPGSYPYHCMLHPPSNPAYSGFTGTITVTP